MTVSLADMKSMREHALFVHQKWKQEIALADKIDRGEWEILWPDGGLEESEPLVENVYNQALEDKTLSAGAILPQIFTFPRRGTRSDRGEQNAAKRKRSMLAYWDNSRLAGNLKRYYRDIYHTGAVYGIPWCNWYAPPEGRHPFFLRLDPRQVFPLGRDSTDRLTVGLVMRQRRIDDLTSPPSAGGWGEDHPIIKRLLAERETRNQRAEYFEEIFFFDSTEWAVAIADSQLPATWQGTPWVPGDVSQAQQGSLIVDWLKPPEAHYLDTCPLKEARRVTGDDQIRGALVDVIPGLKVAQNFMAALLDDLQASVYAPVMLDNIKNFQDYGPGAVLVGDGTGKAQVVRDRPAVNFEAQQTVAQIIERARNQAFEPGQRSGEAGASIVSQKGIVSLMGSFNSELAAAQYDIQNLIQELTSACANLDEVWAPGTKQIWGVDDNSKAYDESYDPTSLYGGDYRCIVTYGERSGLDEQNWLIRLATMKNIGAISLRTLMMKAGISEDVLAEETDMAIENLINLFYQGVLPQRIQAGDLTALKAFVDKLDDDEMTVRAAVLDTIREMTEMGPLDGQGQGQPGSRADIMRMVRSLDRGGIPGSAEGQPPTQISPPAFAPAVRRGLQAISPGGNG